VSQKSNIQSGFLFGSFGTANVPKNEEPLPFIFEDGTARIIVTYKNNRIIGKVSPYAMALASPIWKKFVFPPFRKDSGTDSAEKTKATKPVDPTKPDSPKEVNNPKETNTAKSKDPNSTMEPVEELDFAEDSAEALLILLNITHFRFTSIPTTLSLDLLSNVAILCDQYDCVHLVEPWLSQWLVVRERIDWTPAPTAFRGGIREKWLFIAWVFGYEQAFRELSSLLLREMETSAKGDNRASTINFGPMPLGIIGTLTISYLSNF
jgi:hypothetical protein